MTHDEDEEDDHGFNVCESIEMVMHSCYNLGESLCGLNICILYLKAHTLWSGNLARWRDSEPGPWLILICAQEACITTVTR